MKNIKPENVCHVVFQARQLRNIETVLEDDHGDDAQAGDVIDTVIEDETVHQEHEQDPTYLEVSGFIKSVPIEAQHDLIALAWLGRGDSFKADWDGLLELAEERWTKQTPEYLLWGCLCLPSTWKTPWISSDLAAKSLKTNMRKMFAC